MKTIRRYFNTADAVFAQSLLASVGIKAVLAEEIANTLGPGYSPGGVRLQVPEEEEGRAVEILAGGHDEFMPLPDDFVPPETPGENEIIPPRVEGFESVRELLPAGLCMLGVLVGIFTLYMLLAPLSWTHSSASLILMGNAAEKSGNYSKALKCYDAALVVNSRSSVASYNRGLVFFKQADYEKAIADFGEAMKLNPFDAQCLRLRCMAYKRLGAYEKALEDINRAIETAPENYAGYADRGIVYSKMGDSGRALEDYHHAMELAPERSLAYNNLAWLYATFPKSEVRDGTKARELALKACELSDWKKFNEIGTLAAAEAETGCFDEAIKHQEQALDMAKADKATERKMLDQMADALNGYRQRRPYRDLNK